MKIDNAENYNWDTELGCDVTAFKLSEPGKWKLHASAPATPWKLRDFARVASDPRKSMKIRIADTDLTCKECSVLFLTKEPREICAFVDALKAAEKKQTAKVWSVRLAGQDENFGVGATLGEALQGVFAQCNWVAYPYAALITDPENLRFEEYPTYRVYCCDSKDTAERDIGFVQVRSRLQIVDDLLNSAIVEINAFDEVSVGARDMINEAFERLVDFLVHEVRDRDVDEAEIWKFLWPYFNQIDCFSFKLDGDILSRQDRSSGYRPKISLEIVPRDPQAKNERLARRAREAA